jgi:hypothetical protein
VDLPTAEQIKLAIDGFWRGGGTTTLIVNVCRRMECSLEEAGKVAQRLAEAASNGLRHITDATVEQNVEMVRASERVKFMNRLKVSLSEDGFDPGRCLFSDVLDCPQCSAMNGAPWKHGRLLSPEELSANIQEAHSYLRALFAEADPSWKAKRDPSLNGHRTGAFG